MSAPILATKFYIPSPRPKMVFRPALIERLNEGEHRKLALISAGAGFGKSTLLSNWVATCEKPVAWLSLDEEHRDPVRFLLYFVAALQTIDASIGEGLMVALQSPQPPPPEAILTTLLNEITAVSTPFLFVLDDYHILDAPTIDKMLTFLLDHLPPQMHLVIGTREDPSLPLARLRARNQLTELRAADLRFSAAEAANFLNQVMDLNLSASQIEALERRTEGWIAGLQLAALALKGQVTFSTQQDASGFIDSFTGSHRFVLDYLVEEVLNQQPAHIQAFLLQTSILNRLSGSLCEALLSEKTLNGQDTLGYLEQANLFIVPLDQERQWYRYHHLFGDLLQKRLQQSDPEGTLTTVLHQRASQWLEEHDLELEAFYHATAVNDHPRTIRIIEGKGLPLHLRGAAVPILNWLNTLPKTVLDAYPILWITQASSLLVLGQLASIEEKLQHAEASLAQAEPNEQTPNLIGRIGSIRASVGVSQHNAEFIIKHAQIALQHLSPHNLPVRLSVTWALGYAYHLKGKRAEAEQAYLEVIPTCRAIGHHVIGMMSLLGLGDVQALQNELHKAAETFYEALELAGEPPQPASCEAHLGLARISYQWNDLEAARAHWQRNIELAKQLETTDRVVGSELFLARLELAEGALEKTAVLLNKAEQAINQHGYKNLMPELISLKVRLLLQEGDVETAVQVATTHKQPLSQARAYLAHNQPAKALTVLKTYHEQASAQDWRDDLLKTAVLLAIAHHAQNETDSAHKQLTTALSQAEPSGHIRLFVDEGPLVADILTNLQSKSDTMKPYIHSLLNAFGKPNNNQSLVDPLSERELEVLQLIAEGLSNRQISERLFLALSTVKGHNRLIFDKLQVKRRTEAVARARELSLL